jgi:phosphate transport system substrate-binding protein
MNKIGIGAIVGSLALMAMGLVACGKEGDVAGLAGTLNIDGSGTVFPIAAGMAEVFNESNSEANIAVGKAGTGGGMKIFAKGETDIANASRPIKSSEIEELGKAGIEFMEVPIAYDGICIVVHPSNDFASTITVEQLNKVWDKAQEGKSTKWSDIDPSWPGRVIKLYGPTSAHGTYEYFNEVVNGDGENVRPDYSQQAEYETLIKGVESEEDALGYVGFAYYDQNKEKLKVLSVTTESGTVTPSVDTIKDGTYVPFSRPLMMYVKKSSYDSNPVCKGYIEMVLSGEGSSVISQVGYVPLPDDMATLVKARIKSMTLGSVLSGASAGQSLADLLSK